MTTYLYSGYVDCGGAGVAVYEFQSDEILDGMEQLDYLLTTGILQIMDNAPEKIEEDE